MKTLSDEKNAEAMVQGGSVERVAMPVIECLDSQEGCSIAYRVRTSARARNVRLQLAADGLTVVVPLHFDLCRIPAIVERKSRG